MVSPNNSTKEKFIEKSRKIHGERYDYSLVEYINNKTKVKIICKEHGVFEQRPDNHIQGNNCPICGNIAKRKSQTNWDTELFIKHCNKIHKKKYDYSLIEYNGYIEKVKIICPIHGVFEQAANSHINGNGCGLCSNNKKFTKEYLLNEFHKLHNDKYEYDIPEIFNIHTRINIKCKNHGWFKQRIRKHLMGRGCRICNNSNSENLIQKFLIDNNIKFKRNYSYKDCAYINVLFFDFYLPEKNCCLEYDGEQHFVKFRWEDDEDKLIIRQKRDEIKNEYCDKNNIRLIRIRYDENLLDRLNEIFN